MKRLLIVDNEADDRCLLKHMIRTLCPDVQICGEANSVEQAYVLIRQQRPDAILLDISLRDGTGFDLLDKWQQPPFRVIFTTAYNEFAVKAFRYHALDYLLKPVVAQELTEAIDALSKPSNEGYANKIEHLLESAQQRKVTKITLTSLDSMILVPLDQIVHLESDASYTTFHLLDRECHVVSRPLKDFEDLLPDETFFRIHQSHLINLTLIKKIMREDGGYVVMTDGCKIPIARRRKEAFLDVIRMRFPSS